MTDRYLHRNNAVRGLDPDHEQMAEALIVLWREPRKPWWMTCTSTATTQRCGDPKPTLVCVPLLGEGAGSGKVHYPCLSFDDVVQKICTPKALQSQLTKAIFWSIKLRTALDAHSESLPGAGQNERYRGVIAAVKSVMDDGYAPAVRVKHNALLPASVLGAVDVDDDYSRPRYMAGARPAAGPPAVP